MWITQPNNAWYRLSPDKCHFKYSNNILEQQLTPKALVQAWVTKMEARRNVLIWGQLKKNPWGPKVKLPADTQSYHSSLQGSVWILRLERGGEIEDHLSGFLCCIDKNTPLCTEWWEHTHMLRQAAAPVELTQCVVTAFWENGRNQVGWFVNHPKRGCGYKGSEPSQPQGQISEPGPVGLGPSGSRRWRTAL